MSFPLCLLLLIGVHAFIDLADGQSQTGHITSSVGGTNTFRFHVDEPQLDKDLSVVLTTFSDWTDPDLYMSVNEEPTPTTAQWKSSTMGSDTIVLDEKELMSDADYFILVTCSTYCRFRITVSYAEEMTLTDGQPQQGTLIRRHTEVYKYVVPEASSGGFRIRAVATTGYVKMHVAKGEHSDPSSENSLSVTTTMQNGMQCEVLDAVPGEVYKIAIVAMTESEFVVSVVPTEGVTELQASKPTEGEVDTEQFLFYKFYVDDPLELVTIKITAYSGDPDVYVKHGSQPTQIDFDFHSELYGDETLVITQQDRNSVNAETGWYYIGVLGHYHSIFTLTVSINNDSVVPLFNGNPQQGYVEKGQVDLYYADVASQTDFNVMIRVSPLTGDPDLFAKLCTANLTNCKFTVDEFAHSENYPDVKKSTRPFGDDVLSISHKASMCAVNRQSCRYLIAVVGQSSTKSSFSIVITTSNSDETILRDGRPEHFSLIAGEERYYKFIVSNTTVDDVTFMLTPEQGDPNLYVSRIAAMPTHDNAEKLSEQQSSSIDSVRFERGIDGEMLNSTYHITVKARTASTFSIVAKETVPTWNSTIRLVPGHAQLDTVYNYTKSDYRIYTFTLHYTLADAQPIHISLTPYTGKYTIYVANRPENLDWDTEMFRFNWCTCNASHTNHATVLDISSDDRWYRYDSTYLVLVQAFEFTADHSATYSLTYSTGDTTVRLQEGVQYADDVDEGAYKYYSFPVHEAHEDISIKLTTFSGDPDLYLSIHPNNTKPDRDNYDFLSSAFGGEVMTLNWEQGLSDVCPKQAEYTSDPQLCMLYIGVYGYKQASYTIKVITRKDIPELMVEGFPVTGQINETQFDYYYIYLGVNSPVTIAMESLSGDPDLFVSLLDANTSEVVEDWPRPNKVVFDFASQSMANDIIRISSAELASRCPSKACVVLTGVYCFSAYCRYSINANQESIAVLLDSQPVNGYIEEFGYNYYSFIVNIDDANILISLTSTSEGDPALVVSKGPNTRPTSENCTWGSYIYGHGYLMISADDPSLEGSTRGVYVIGVFGYMNTTYTLTATSAAIPVIMMVPGTPHSAILMPNSTSYYYFWIENESPVTVTITFNSGSALLVANKANFDPYENLPTLQRYDWSSVGSNNRNEIEIKPSDDAFCMYCLVVVGVFSQESSIGYSITVTYSNTQLMLQNGVPHRDFIESGTWQYYSFNVNENVNFAVSLASYSGDSDLYIGLENPITFENAIWKSDHGSKVDHIRIKSESDDFVVGTYVIGVYGVKDSSYSVTAHARNSYITLIDGWPQTYSVGYHDHDHLLFWYTQGYYTCGTGNFSGPISNADTYCRLMPLSPDFFPNLYYTFQPWSESKPVPSDKNHDVSFSADVYDSVFTEMKFKLPFNDTGAYLIGVYGDSTDGHSKHEFGDFELYCSSEDQFNILRVGYSEFEVLTPKNATKRYELHINEPGTLEVFVEPCIGKVSLGISSNFTQVNDTELVVTRITDGKLVANVPQALGHYYITVSEVLASSFYEGASYQLTSRFTGVGQPRQKNIIPGDNGLLLWETVDRGDIKLNWSPVTYEDGSEIDQVKDPVVYRVYFTNEPSFVMLTACEMHAGELLDVVFNPLEDGFTKKTEVTGHLGHDTKFMVNVVAYLRHGEGGMLEHVVYTPTEVYLPRPHDSGGFLVYAIIGGVLVLSLGAACVFYRRYKRVQSQLLYEMTDVRNVAGLSSESFTEENLSSVRDSSKYSPIVVRQ